MCAHAATSRPLPPSIKISRFAPVSPCNQQTILDSSARHRYELKDLREVRLPGISLSSEVHLVRKDSNRETSNLATHEM